MGRRLLHLFVMICFVVVLIASTKSVQAAGVNLVKPTAESDHWNTGTEITVDLSLYPAPPSWQQFGKAVIIEEPVKLCHPFDKGRYGWTGSIYQLISDHWVKLTTEVGWIPNEEGKYTACANVTAPGTYALFAFYTKPDEVDNCSKITADWYMNYFDAADYPELYPELEGYYLDAYVPNIPVGTSVTYTILKSDDHLLADMSGTTNAYLYEGESMWADFVESSPIQWKGGFTITVKLTAAGCSKTVTFSIF